MDKTLKHLVSSILVMGMIEITQTGATEEGVVELISDPSLNMNSIARTLVRHNNEGDDVNSPLSFSLLQQEDNSNKNGSISLNGKAGVKVHARIIEEEDTGGRKITQKECGCDSLCGGNVRVDGFERLLSFFK